MFKTVFKKYKHLIVTSIILFLSLLLVTQILVRFVDAPPENKKLEMHVVTKKLVVIHFNDATTKAIIIDNPNIITSEFKGKNCSGINSHWISINNEYYYYVKYYEVYEHFNEHIELGIMATDYYSVEIEPYINIRDTL